jgi:predicted RNA-binding protein with PIN domain
VIWLVDANNVFGSRPDGWWNDRDAAGRRLTQCVAEWCRTHDDEVVLVFDAPLAPATRDLQGGNLRIEEAQRRGRDAADDRIVELASEIGEVTVVSSDRGLRLRLPGSATVMGTGRFRELVGY